MKQILTVIKGFIDVLIGLQWGDEGKGKIVDYLLSLYDIVVRFQGGPNAGHTLEFEGNKIVLHSLPCAFGQKDKIGCMGAGMVGNPIKIVNEIHELESLGIEVISRLFISRHMSLIAPFHIYRDMAEEKRKEVLTGKKIGTTCQGIGPAYEDKYARRSLRMGDIFSPDFLIRFEAWEAYHMEQFTLFDKYFSFPMEEYKKDKAEWLRAIEFIRTLHIIDLSQYLLDAIKQGKKILAEGAQGSGLDVDFGDFPNVTSSSTYAAHAAVSLGVPAHSIHTVMGVVKFYATKVGSGAFPSRMPEEVEEKFRKDGCEYGATTGRPRNCGWLDLVALRYAVERNNITKVFITKVDVCPSDVIHVVTGYKKDDKIIKEFPATLDGITCVTKEHRGWKVSPGSIETQDIPSSLCNFLNYLENVFASWDCGPIAIEAIGTGPDRKDIVRWQS
jgi:adenylosuccinate synthase